MSQVPFKPASFGLSAFNCPHCRAYAKQSWWNAYGVNENPRGSTKLDNHCFSVCENCSESVYWIDRQLIYPSTRTAPMPNNDMIDDIRLDYEEAAAIQQISPRGAAALLRLCIQKLCKQIGEKGENINKDVESLVVKGLPVEIKQALDVVRVIGNNAVHPGEMDIMENPENVNSLFVLVNLIADRMISQPKIIANLHLSLPQGAQDAITKRDARALPKPS